jgi:sterol desaturase/sphingolipid hydroxylase (fatty acid hydroxylase superfamily)
VVEQKKTINSKMLLSIGSLKNFCIVNGFLFLLGWIHYSAMMFYEKTKSLYSPYSDSFYADSLFTLVLFLLRNWVLVYYIDEGNKNRPRINTDPAHIPKEHYPGEFLFNVLTTTMVEAVTHVILKRTIFLNRVIIDSPFTFLSIVISFVSFAPISFCFEVIFDFFHYFTHRLGHHRWVYRFFHKKHHTYQHPTSITTFYQDPFDLIVTNSIPTYLGLFLTGSMISYSMFHWILIYKNVIEISGHSGKTMYPTTSFPQFIWFPKWIFIELATEDHDLHHSLNFHLHHSSRGSVHYLLEPCNYGKRFSLWDKVFGTYESPFGRRGVIGADRIQGLSEEELKKD